MKKTKVQYKFFTSVLLLPKGITIIKEDVKNVLTLYKLCVVQADGVQYRLRVCSAGQGNNELKQ